MILWPLKKWCMDFSLLSVGNMFMSTALVRITEEITEMNNGQDIKTSACLNILYLRKLNSFPFLELMLFSSQHSFHRLFICTGRHKRRIQFHVSNYFLQVTMSHIIYKYRNSKQPTVSCQLIARSRLNTVFWGKTAFAFPLKQKKKSSYWKISSSSAFNFTWNSLLCLPPCISQNVGGQQRGSCFQTYNTKMFKITCCSFHISMEQLTWKHWIIKGLYECKWRWDLA